MDNVHDILQKCCSNASKTQNEEKFFHTSSSSRGRTKAFLDERFHMTQRGLSDGPSSPVPECAVSQVGVYWAIYYGLLVAACGVLRDPDLHGKLAVIGVMSLRRP